MRGRVLCLHLGRRLRKGVLLMDPQTVIALCAVFGVVISIVGLARPRDQLPQGCRAGIARKEVKRTAERRHEKTPPTVYKMRGPS